MADTFSKIMSNNIPGGNDEMNFPSFEGIAFFFASFVKNLFLHFLTNYCSFVFTAYKEGICTGIFILGFRSSRTYETLNFFRHEPRL